MEVHLSPNLRAILERAAEEALRTGSPAIEADHLALGILRHKENDAARTLEKMGVDSSELKDFLDTFLFRPGKVVGSTVTGSRPQAASDPSGLSATKETRALVSKAIYEALKASRDEADPAHLLLSIVKDGQNHTSAFLKENGIDAARLESVLREEGLLKPTVRDVTPIPENTPHIFAIPKTPTGNFS